LTFVPAVDKYVCSVLAQGRITHCQADTPAEARGAAQEFVEGQYGPIRVDRPEHHVAELRIARWNGVPFLLGGEQAIQLFEEEVAVVARGNSAQAQGYFQRFVRIRLGDNQKDLLDAWLVGNNWERLPIDAVFAASYPDFDYLTD
jgi:hypothetical protein